MRATRRSWAVAGLAVALALLAVVLDHPLGLAGAALLGAWLLSRQWAFLAATTDFADGLAVEQTVDATAPRQHTATEATIRATLAEPSDLEATLDAGVPPTATSGDPATVRVHGTHAETTIDLTWPVSGRHTFSPATVALGDGLFAESIKAGSRPTVTVEPPGVRDIHVGAGGERRAIAYGEHKVGRPGPGIEPARLREYVPGDPADWIDWKATARLARTHVREFEVETDQATTLLVDHRIALGEGPVGETKLDLLRAVALTVLAAARRADDPIALVAVDDDGISTQVRPGASADTYATCRRHLIDLRARRREARRSPGARRQLVTGERARTVQRHLAGDDSRFASTLRPFVADRGAYHRRLEDRPLYGGLLEALAATSGPGLTVILTDDAALPELDAAVKRARHDDEAVLVCIAPSVLFDADLDHETAYRRYVAFEDERRRFARMDGVRALEVGPRDRLGEVLAAGRDRRVAPGAAR